MHVEPRSKVLMIFNFVESELSTDVKVTGQCFLSALVGFEEIRDTNFINNINLIGC